MSRDGKPSKNRATNQRFRAIVLHSLTSLAIAFPPLLPPSDYRWKVRLFDRDRLVDATGGRGIESDLGRLVYNCF